MGHFWVQNGLFTPNNFFGGKSLILSSSTYWPISLCKILKSSYSRPKVTTMRHFWNKNGPICPNKHLSENLLINVVPVIHAYLHFKNITNHQVNGFSNSFQLINNQKSPSSWLDKYIFAYELRKTFWRNVFGRITKPTMVHHLTPKKVHMDGSFFFQNPYCWLF